MIEVSQLIKTFKLNKQQRKKQGVASVNAVDDVSFTCRPGRIFALLGPNGAGKTTTLRMLATMLRPTSGSIRIAGHDAATHPADVRRSIGFLTGSTQLYDRLTPDEVVKYFADLYGMDKQTFRQRKDELFTQLGIHDYSGQRIAKLSTGMKQKVSIVRSIIHDPDVVIFDEATSGLDVIAAGSIIDLIRDCRDRGKTVIFSTHRMGEVGLLAEDLAVINNGRIIYNGSFTDFKDRMQTDSLEEAFINLVKQSETQTA